MAEFKVPLRFKAFENVSATVKKMQNSIRGLNGTLRNTNNRFRLLQAKTDQFRKAAGRMGQGMKSTGRTMTTSLTAPIGLFAGAMFRTAVNFDRAMNTVEAKATKGGKSIDDLRKKAKELGSTTQFSAVQAGEAMQFLAQAGFDTDKIFNAIGPSLDLAAASGTDLARTADIMSNIMGAFKIPAESAARAADVLAQVTAKSNVDMEQLADTMKAVAPVANDFGASIEETGAIAGILGNIGIQGSMAGTAMKQAFLGLAAPASKARKILTKLGIDIEDKTTGKLRPVSLILGEMAGKLATLPKKGKIAVLNEVFGKRGIAGATELMTQAIDKNGNQIVEFTKVIADSEGAASKMAKTINKGSVGAVAQFISAFEGLQLAITESGIIDIFTDIANGMANWFREMSKTSPVMLKFGFIAALLVAALGPILILLGSLVAMAPAIITGLTAIGAVLAGITLAGVILAAKILLVVAAIGLLIFGVMKLVEHWSAVVEFFTFDSAIDSIIAMIEWTKQLGASIVTNITEKLASITDLLPDRIKSLIGIEGPEAGGDKTGGASKAVAREITQQNIRQTRDARATVDFKNVPPGVQVRNDNEQPFDQLGLGLAGGL